MTNKSGLVLGFFRDGEAASKVLWALRRAGYGRVATIAKNADGHTKIEVRELSETQGAALGGALGLVLARALPLPVVPGLRLARSLTGGAGAILGAAAGRLLARGIEWGVPDEALQLYERWVVPGETLVLAQVPRDDIEAVLEILREDDENRPTTFIVRPHLRREGELLAKIRAVRPISKIKAAKPNISPVPSRPSLQNAPAVPEEDAPADNSALRLEPLVGDRLREHAARTARRHSSLVGARRARPLINRLRHNERIINGVCRSLAEAARLEQPISLSAEWLLDNAYIIQSQIADVRGNLSRAFYAELPVLRSTRAASSAWENTRPEGTTRAYAIAHDLVAHTDGRLDERNILEYLSAYQEGAPLTMGELWALPLMFRVALVENLLHLTLEVDHRQRDRERADFWANRLLVASHSRSDQMLELLADLSREQPELGAHFADRLISGLYDEEAALVPVRSWIERKLGASLAEILDREQRRQTGDQIAVANTIGSLRQLSQIDWREVFESLSAVEQVLKSEASGVYQRMDFATRDRYRHEIERIARGARSEGQTKPLKTRDTARAEIEIAQLSVQKAARALQSTLAAPQSTLERDSTASNALQSTLETDSGASHAAQRALSDDAPDSAALQVISRADAESPALQTPLQPASHVGFHLIDEGARELESEVDYQAPTAMRARRWLLDHPETFYGGALGVGTVGATALTLYIARRVGPRVLGPLGMIPLGLLASGPASELALQLLNFAITKTLPPRALPKMSFESGGVPDRWRTIVVVPMMLGQESGIEEDVERLEVRFLANNDANLRFALLADYVDADERVTPDDEERLAAARRGIEMLNRRYEALSVPDANGQYQPCDRFLLFGRERRWSESESKWMGWERKRGKLEELNALLCGQSEGAPEALHLIVGTPDSLNGIAFVITLDSDTQLPHETARHLIETLAHPLNRPLYQDGKAAPDAAPLALPTRGYTLIQPRVSTSLPSATETRFSRLFTDPNGSDPYTHAISDVYQDLFGEGSYHGKGIYDLQAFHRSLAERFPNATLLSHDLLEGAHVRVGLASDVELFDQFPPNYLSYARRNHRWLRGDWQILDWISKRVPSYRGHSEINPLSKLNKWKVGDNLRRSLLPIASMALLSVAWLQGPSAALGAGVLVGAGLLLPAFVQFITWLPSRVGGVRVIARELRDGVWRAGINAALLPHSATLSIDAIGRTLYRRLVTQRDLLEWQTAQANYSSAQDSERALIVRLTATSLWAGLNAAALALWSPAALPFATPFLLAWTGAPLLVRWLGGGRQIGRMGELSGDDQKLLRRIARQTWRYFDDFVGPQTRWLPPDNYQETLRVEIAGRTSPTNIGLWLMSLLAAHDFGYLPFDEVIARSTATFETLNELERFRGHLFNWYDVQSGLPLKPRYVSTVDSGNLLGSLWTMAQGVRGLLSEPLISRQPLNGLLDTLGLLRESLGEAPPAALLEAIAEVERLLSDASTAPLDLITRLRASDEPARRVLEAVGVHVVPRPKAARDLLDSEAATLEPRFQIAPAPYWASQLVQQIEAWSQQIERYLTWLELLREVPAQSTLRPDDELLLRREEALKQMPSLEDLGRGDVPALNRLLELRTRAYLAPELLAWLEEIAREFGRNRWLAGEMRAQAEALIDAMKKLGDETDMRFLFDEERNLFTVGFNVEEMRRDNSYYDLLASECRVASFVCVARGEIPLDHWVSLGRRYGRCNGRAALQSWSGTMFEYLMPLLMMRPFDNSLLESACRNAVLCQADYGRERGVPWGISEAAFAALDAGKTYQYRAFGVPGLGLKRGLEDDLVVAPYATLLSFLVEPTLAMQNLRRLISIGMRGDYGFYESIDYSRQRLRDDDPETLDVAARGAIVRCFMVHHQGMSLIALDNVLHGGAMQNRFHADPYVQAAEPLLHERIPLAPPVLEETIGERPPARLALDSSSSLGATERLMTADSPLPRVQLLSNGNYSLMITNSGGGYSRWRDFEITRWRADSTRDNWGAWCYFKDLESGVTWSATHQPLRRAARQAQVLFTSEKAEFRRRDADIETVTEIVVSPEDDAEVRRITLVNHSEKAREIEVTSFAEISLAPHAADRAHPAFAKLFIQTAVVEEGDALLAWRRPRSSKDTPVWAGHLMIVDESTSHGNQSTLEGEAARISWETDRAQFLGRNRSAENPHALNAELSGSTGAVLDPVFALRRRVLVGAGQRVEVSFITVVAESRDGVLGLLQKYREPFAARRTLDVAWTNAQVEMHHLRIQPEDGQRFQQLAGYMIYPYAALRAPAKRIRDNHKGQNGLWAYGISGDLPIMIVAIDDQRDLSVVRQALVAHTFWRVRGLKADLVILNEQAGGYNQDLTEQLSNLILSTTYQVGMNQPGGVFLCTADTLPAEDLTLLFAVGRVVIVAARGNLEQQLANAPLPAAPEARLVVSQRVAEEPSAPLPFMELPYFNGVGGFSGDGREYAIYLARSTANDWKTTPAPWCNVLANPGFGALVTEAGQGFAWSGNSQSNRLTPWSNDPVSDLPGEAIYIRDDDSGVFWSPTISPIRENDEYRTRHGAGYSIFEHNSHAIEQELTTWVPIDNAQSTLDGPQSTLESPPLRVQRLKLRNGSSRRRRLTVTFYAEWILGTTREETQPHIVSSWDAEAKILLARNAYHPDFGHRVAWATSVPAPRYFTGDRTNFVGRNGSLLTPSALRRTHLDEHVGAGLDACAGLQVSIALEPGEESEVSFLLGQSEDVAHIRPLVERMRGAGNVQASLDATRAWWDDLLGALQIETPVLSVDLLVNRWLLYQTLACRIWGRSALYQSGGAYGFRDQLQDVMAMVYASPDVTRAQIIRAAGHQFPEGDVQHWWHPPGDAGVRTRISDDLLFLPYVVAHYIRVTGDESVLDEIAPFLGGRVLEPDEHETYMPPEPSTESGTIFEHCRRALEKGCTKGPHDLPLIGAGDWNDGMNRVGVEGEGESVWLAWFAIDVLNQWAEVCVARKESTLARQYRARAKAYSQAVEKSAWDGDWYLRAFFDDGTPLGSHLSDEAKIDALPQAWSVLSGAGNPERSEQALQALETHLVKREEGMILLFTPAFDQTATDPGYIKGYLPGVRENGGQYTHAAVWSAMSFARAGHGGKAVELLKMLNPIEHARTPEAVETYKVEPYVVAADVYNLENAVGRGGWTWYTGSSSWMYRAWVEEIIGFKKRANSFSVEPSVPSDWTQFGLRYRHQSTLYIVRVENPDGVETGVIWVEIDGKKLRGKSVPLIDDGQTHQVTVHMGAVEKKNRAEAVIGAGGEAIEGS